MTIYELANGTHAVRVELPEGYQALRETFPAESSDFLVAENGQLVIAINHLTGKFAVSRVGCCVLGDSADEIAPDQLRRLQNATV